jgi:hypothetical protein
VQRSTGRRHRRHAAGRGLDRRRQPAHLRRAPGKEARGLAHERARHDDALARLLLAHVQGQHQRALGRTDQRLAGEEVRARLRRIGGGERRLGLQRIDSRAGAKTCTSSSECNASLGELCGIREGATSGRCIPTWFGICHAWAAATILWPEPKHEVTRNGVTFRVQDIKALMTLVHDRYEYILELDATGRIVGGEWLPVSRRSHPDFLWIPTRVATSSVARGAITYANVKDLVDASQ